MKLDFNIFDSLLGPCVILNREHLVVYCNEAAAILFSISIRKIIRSKLKIENLLEFKDVVPAIERIEEVLGPTPVQEVQFKSLASGDLGKLQISVQPIDSGEDEKLWLIFVRDVTLEEHLQNKYKGELDQKEAIISDLMESKKIIEDYNMNLEKKVSERTQEMRDLNQTLTALLDSLNQGFFIFDKGGVCLSVYSKACDDILEGRPVGRHFADVLNLVGEEKIKVCEWVQFVFEQTLPFEESVLFGPNTRKHSKGKHIELEYYPIYTVDLKISSVVVVASDTTSLLEARKDVEFEKHQAKLILNILRNRKQIHNFIEDCKKIIKKLNTEIDRPVRFRDQAEMFRCLHTLKGGSASVGIIELSEHCHLAENILAEVKHHHPSSVEYTEKWQKLVMLISDIEDNFFRFLDYTAQLTGRSLSSERILEISYTKFINILYASEPTAISEPVRNLLIEEILMEPVIELVKGYQESLDLLAGELGKQLLPLEIIGGYLKILPDHYKKLFNTLVHVFRNAIDHGIERPEQRIALGKPEAGKISIEFQLKGENLVIAIKDDGSGINAHVIRSRLLKIGKDTTQESDKQVIQHIFDAGFSTRQEVSTISGRGVGMDAVRQVAVDMGGSAQVVSHLNEGTIFIIEVPYLRKVAIGPTEILRQKAK